MRTVPDLIARMRRRSLLPANEAAEGIPMASIAEHLPTNPVVVEAGAHIGRDTVRMARAWPNGRIHAFEPLPRIFDQLRGNTARLRNVYLYELALGARTGSELIHVSSGASDGSSSLLEPKEHLSAHPEVRFDQAIEVGTITLDDWAERESVERVDLLWLDLQGLEPLVLEHGQRVLATVSAIHTEVNLIESYADGLLYPEFRAWLEARGFTVAAEELPWEDAGNVLFVRAT